MKTKFYLVITLLILGVRISNGQINLVPNPGFDSVTTCNFGAGGLYQGIVPFWDSPSNGSPDIFNTCCTNLGFKVPNIGYGYQQTHSGSGFAGCSLFISNQSDYREYIQVKLDSTLIAGKQYCVSFYVSLANISRYAISNIGLYFSNTHTYVPNDSTLNLIPQINNSNIITDTANWTLISGQYIASGGEQYIIIGNFTPEYLTDSLKVNNSTVENYAYYFFDDVSIIDCTTVGVDELNLSNFSLYPNPVEDKLNIKIDNNEPTEITLYDISSRKLLRQTFINTTTINTEQLAKGMYLYEVRNKNGIIKNGKVVKE